MERVRRIKRGIRNAEMEAILSHYFGYQSFRPGQKEIITKILAHHNVLGVLPTGGENRFVIKFPG